MPETPQLCPHFHRAIELIGRRWTGAIIWVLLQAPARFSEIRAAIPEITDRMLSERLRELEEECVVARRAAGRCTEYTLTERGLALAEAVAAVASWSHEWLAEERGCPPQCAEAVAGVEDAAEERC